jgi:hypothetical protein
LLGQLDELEDHGKSDGGALSVVRMGLGRQAGPPKGFLAEPADTYEIDLDTSALLFASGQLTDVVFFQQLDSKDGPVRHVATRTGLHVRTVVTTVPGMSDSIATATNLLRRECARRGSIHRIQESR